MSRTEKPPQQMALGKRIACRKVKSKWIEDLIYICIHKNPINYVEEHIGRMFNESQVIFNVSMLLIKQKTTRK